MAENLQWVIDMVAEPVIPAWTHHGHVGQNGSELQRTLLDFKAKVGVIEDERAACLEAAKGKP